MRYNMYLWIFFLFQLVSTCSVNSVYAWISFTVSEWWANHSQWVTVCLKNLGLHAAVKTAVTVQTSCKLKQLACITSLLVNCQQSLSFPKMYFFSARRLQEYKQIASKSANSRGKEEKESHCDGSFVLPICELWQVFESWLLSLWLFSWLQYKSTDSNEERNYSVTIYNHKLPSMLTNSCITKQNR